jgi:hypothetical protein
MNHCFFAECKKVVLVYATNTNNTDRETMTSCKTYFVIGLGPGAAASPTTSNNHQSSLHPRQRRLFSVVTRRDTRAVVAFNEDEVHLADHVASLLDAWRDTTAALHHEEDDNKKKSLLFIKKSTRRRPAGTDDLHPTRTPTPEPMTPGEFNDLPATHMLGTICVSHVLDEDDHGLSLVCSSVREPDFNKYEKYVHYLASH